MHGACGSQAEAPRTRADPTLALLYAFAFVGFPLISVLPVTIGVPSRPISVAYRIVVLALAIFAIARWFVSRRRLVGGWPLACFAILWVLLLARLIWDSAFVLLPLDLEWGEYFSFAIGISLVPAVAMLEIPSASTLRLALWLTHVFGVLALLTVGALAVTTILQGRLLERLGTDVLNPASVGYLAATVLVTSLATNALLRRSRSRVARLVSLAGAALMIIAVAVAVASVTKGVILDVLATLLLVATLGIDRKMSPARVAARLFGVAMAVGTAVALAFVIEEVSSIGTVSRITGFLDDESTYQRTLMARGALEQFAAHPWLGDAIVELGSRDYPHNVFLEAAMATGIVGLIALAALVLAAVRAAAELTRQGWVHAWLALLFAEYLIAAALSGSLIFLSPFWAASAGVLAVAGAGSRDHSQRTS